MTEATAGAGQVRGYHAHIYYDPADRGAAERLRAAIGDRFAVELGRWHDEPVGPHPGAMYQVAFPAGEFARLVPWLMLNRGGLGVLLHPQTGDAYADHTVHAAWLGKKLPLRLDVLRRAATG
ncbi:MAG TPA: DOPA 4,5-dioxygenase family protein [Stellaceae bacterium]|nr:DOPA 4,5-dioxygenase family protein [Stellaceae bacterium]